MALAEVTNDLGLAKASGWFSVFILQGWPAAFGQTDHSLFQQTPSLGFSETSLLEYSLPGFLLGNFLR